MKVFKKLIATALLVVGLGQGIGLAQITVPNTLVAGATIRANELNTNFTDIAAKALNRISGGTIEGNVTLTDNVTFDGVDISDFLTSTQVLTQATGSAGTPSFSVVGDLNTGLYFPAADEIALSLGGTQRLLLNASGLTVWGTNIINGSGKIPAITSTYFASLDGSALTNINAASATNFSGSLSGDVEGTQSATSIAAGAIVNADINASAGIVDTKLATISTAGKVANSATTANTGAIADTIVLRDGSGVIAAEGGVFASAVSAASGAITAIEVSTLRVGTSTTAGYLLTADASGNATWQVAPSGTIGGSGTVGTIPKFVTNTTTLGNSIITESGSTVAVAGAVSAGTVPGTFGNGMLIANNLPVLDFYDANEAVDNKFWRFLITGGLALQKVNDAYNTATTIFSIDGSGNMNVPALLSVGTFKMTGGSPGSGKVLTSDADGDATWTTPSSDGVPSGAIMLFDASCPTGYTRFSALDSRFPRGNSTYGATGGSDSHDHSFSDTSTASGSHSHTFSATTTTNGAHTHTMSTSSSVQTGSGPSPVVSTTTSSNGDHTHDVSGSTSSQTTHTHDVSGTTGLTGNIPAYLNMIYCKKN